MNYIYEEDLIYESNRERVDWRKMLGKEVRYMFDGVEGTFTVDSYPTNYHAIISNDTTRNFKIKRTSIRDCKLSHFGPVINFVYSLS